MMPKIKPYKGEAVQVELNTDGRVAFTDPALIEVMTVGEVAYGWNKQRKTIMDRIYRGSIEARMSPIGRVWLISRASVIALWGAPLQGNDLVLEHWNDEKYFTGWDMIPERLETGDDE